MIADVDVGFAAVELFAADHFVGNEVQFAKDPGPQFHKEVGDCHGTWSEERGDEDAWEEKQHEEREDEQHPGAIEFERGGKGKGQGSIISIARSESLGKGQMGGGRDFISDPNQRGYRITARILAPHV